MTSSALALGERARRQRPGLRSPRPRASSTRSRSRASRCSGVDFEITRITLDPLDRDAGDHRLPRRHASASRRSCPGKLQFLGESGYSLVRDGIARDVVGPQGLPFAPFLASLFFFILANNLMSIIPFAQISPMSKFAFPLVLAAHLLGDLHLDRHPRAGRRPVLQGHPVPARRPEAHVHPGDADRDPAELHRPAVHAGRPALRQHVRRPHAAAGLLARRDLPVHRRQLLARLRRRSRS